MPKEIIVQPEAGQEVVINPKGSLKIKSSKVSTSKLQARVVVEGVYVEPTPDPPPVPDPPSFPYPSLQAAVNATPNGAQLVVPEKKVFKETVTIASGKTIDIIGAGEGFAIDGAAQRQFAIIGNSNSVIYLRNVEWYGHTTPRQQGAADFNDAAKVTLDSCHGHHNDGSGFSLKGGADHLVKGGRYNNNKQQGYHVESFAKRVTFDGVEFDYNNPNMAEDGYDEAGGGKCSRTDVWLVKNCRVHHNGGPGIWADIDVTNAEWANNKVWANAYAGTMFEISKGLKQHGNAVWDNGVGDRRGWAWPCNVLVTSSDNVEVWDETVGGGTHGISILSQNRGGEYSQMNNVYSHNNTVLRGTGKYVGWYDPDVSDGSSVNDVTNRGGNNLYEGGESGKFEWFNNVTDLNGFKATRGGLNDKLLTAAETTIARAKLVP